MWSGATKLIPLKSLVEEILTKRFNGLSRKAIFSGNELPNSFIQKQTILN